MKTYKEMIQAMVHGHKFKGTEKILEECNIPINSYYKVSNPNKKQPNGNPYNTPLEWIIPLTKATGNFDLIRQLNKDLGMIAISPDRVEALRGKGEDLIHLLEELLKIIK